MREYGWKALSKSASKAEGPVSRFQQSRLLRWSGSSCSGEEPHPPVILGVQSNTKASKVKGVWRSSRVVCQGAVPMQIHCCGVLCCRERHRCKCSVFLLFIMPSGHNNFPTGSHLNDKRLGKSKMLFTELLLWNFPIRFITSSINSI